MSEVSILPQGSSLNSEVNVVSETIETVEYKIKNGKIIGICTGKEALEQSIYFRLGSEKHKHLIYPGDYGVLLDVVGMDEDIAQSEIERRITETLIQDNRINSVDDFEFEVNEDSMLVRCTVYSIYGEIPISKEVDL